MNAKKMFFDNVKMFYSTNYNTYEYNLFNIRTKKTVGTKVYTYTLDNTNIIKEHILDTTNNIDVTLEYIYDANNTLVGVIENENIYYYDRDITGLILGLVDTNGNYVVKYTYTAYGEVEKDILVNTNISTYNPFMYKGYYYDVETNLYYCKSRYYSPELCRWISPDSIEYLDPQSINGLNLYAYCGNDPINLCDPSGHSPEWWQWALFGVGVTLVVVAACMATIGTGGVAAFGAGALVGSLAVGAGSAIVGGAIGYAVAGVDGILGGALAGFGIGSIVGFVVGGSMSYYNHYQNILVKDYISKYARNADDAVDIYKSFEGKIRLKTSRGNVYAYRYYDGTNAFARGRYLTNATTTNPIDDLVLYNNNTTQLARWKIPNGTQYLTGKIAGSPVGAIQYFVGNANWLV